MTEHPCDKCRHYSFCQREHQACDVYCIWEETGVMPLTNIKRIPEKKWFHYMGSRDATN